MPPADSLADEVARLYALPLDEFVAERNAAAKAWKREGRKDDAATIGGLRKPSVVDSALNRTAHRDPTTTRAWADATRRADDAQSATIGGGDAAALRAAVAELRVGDRGDGRRRGRHHRRRAQARRPRVPSPRVAGRCRRAGGRGCARVGGAARGGSLCRGADPAATRGADARPKPKPKPAPTPKRSAKERALAVAPPPDPPPGPSAREQQLARAGRARSRCARGRGRGAGDGAA